jgi:hypothetical protein
MARLTLESLERRDLLTSNYAAAAIPFQPALIGLLLPAAHRTATVGLHEAISISAARSSSGIIYVGTGEADNNAFHGCPVPQTSMAAQRGQDIMVERDETHWIGTVALAEGAGNDARYRGTTYLGEGRNLNGQGVAGGGAFHGVAVGGSSGPGVYWSERRDNMLIGSREY